MAGSRGTVCVAMSGGVDSSVAAAMLKKRGWDVVGVTMQIWQESQRDPRHSGCCSLGAVEDARRVARKLGIPHYVVNFQDAFREAVIDEFVEVYAQGRTPNPCVTCNRTMKFGALAERAKEFGCDAIATGHYARIWHGEGGARLLRAQNKAKDQSYVLYMLSQEQLAKTLLPLGAVAAKTDVRRMAEELDLPVAHKEESQEICFVSEAGGYREYLRKRRPELFQEGEIVDSAGRVLGRHQGVAGYTVGQRRGITVASAHGRALYVLRLDPAANRVVVGENAELDATRVTMRDPVWSAGTALERPVRVSAKIRYNMEPRAATLHPGESPIVEFDEPVRAVTPGQIVVAYRGETVLVGGTID